MTSSNRGVNAMLPKKIEREEKPLYDFKIGFTLFRKEFSITFKVNNEPFKL